MSKDYIIPLNEFNPLKILVIGDSGVGKSSIITKYMDNFFSDMHISTIGIDFRIKKMNIDGKSITLQLWDVAGQERFRSITSIYFRRCNAIIILFDITNRESFDNVKKWISEIDKYDCANIEKILVGNKCDLEQKRVVSIEDAKKFANNMDMMYVETSAKKSTHINDLFENIIKKIIKKYHNIDTIVNVSKNALILDKELYLDDNCDC